MSDLLKPPHDRPGYRMVHGQFVVPVYWMNDATLLFGDVVAAKIERVGQWWRATILPFNSVNDRQTEQFDRVEQARNWVERTIKNGAPSHE